MCQTKFISAIGNSFHTKNFNDYEISIVIKRSDNQIRTFRLKAKNLEDTLLIEKTFENIEKFRTGELN